MLERERHEEILNELLNPELEQSQRTELLQELRVNYGTVLSNLTEITQQNERLQKDNDDLVVSNSKLFRQVGITGTEKEEQEEQKEFSETVTLEALEQNSI